MYPRTLPLVALICLCRAEEAETKRSPQEWKEQLSATYAKHSGFKAGYEARGKRSSLTATLAWDRAGDAVLQLQGVADDKPFGARCWNLDESAFLESDGQLWVDTKIGKIVQRFTELSRQLDLSGDAKPPLTLAFMPRLLLAEDGLNAGLQVYDAALPPWGFDVMGSTAVDVDEQEVVFHTTGSGKISVSRKTGMMTKQEIMSKKGEKHELIISSLEMDLGREAVVEIRRDWSTEGAKEFDLKPLAQAAPLLVFQPIVAEVDSGQATPEKLKEVLAAKSGYLRSLLRIYVDPWKDLSAEDQAQWKEIVLEAKKELGLKEKPDIPAMKAQLSDYLAKLPGQSSEELWNAIFGKGFDELAKPATDKGREARKLIAEAVARAYSEAEAEQRVEDLW
ncbi:hypothetical protein [Haloferula sp. BvORR071]|uniref:hypothetical protein n=1 Tax=Haloferula sp. BvORR071 TaxID=1396141 RepID=UPI0005593B17|nr:hypothetical protein [Haloferula sp. BvORR071]